MDKEAQKWQRRAEELQAAQTDDGLKQYKGVKLSPSGKGVMVKDPPAVKPDSDRQWRLLEGSM